MKKKILAVVLSIFAAVLLVSAFAGCSSETQAAGAGAGTTASITLNKKYIEANEISEPESEQIYYIFTSDDTGLYHYFSSFGSPSGGGTVNSYSVHFRYKIVGEKLFCFYDSAEYDPAHNGDDVRTDWSWEFEIYCDDFLMQRSWGSSGDNIYYYFNEDYLKNEIPNFGK